MQLVIPNYLCYILPKKKCQITSMWRICLWRKWKFRWWRLWAWIWSQKYCYKKAEKIEKGRRKLIKRCWFRSIQNFRDWSQCFSRCEIFGFFLLSFPQNERKCISFAQLVLLCWVYFLWEVCLLFNFWMMKFTIM